LGGRHQKRRLRHRNCINSYANIYSNYRYGDDYNLRLLKEKINLVSLEDIAWSSLKSSYLTNEFEVALPNSTVEL